MRLTCAIFAAFLFAPPMPAPERTVDDFFTTFTDEWMRFHTDWATSMRYFTGAEEDAFERQIAPFTLEHRDAERRLVRNGLRDLRAFDHSKMSDAQRLSADIIAWDLDNRVQGEPFQDYRFPLVQDYGAQAFLTQLMTVMHPVATERDAENYVARLGQLAPRMEEVIVEARRLAGEKLVPPKFILQAAIAQVDGFLSVPAAKNPLVASFSARMQRVKELSSAKQEELRSAAEKITAEQVYPTWRKAKSLLDTEVMKASDDAGLWRLPNGLEAYSYLLRNSTTTKMTAEEIHQTGLRMVDEIETQMDVVLRQLGKTEGSVRTRIDKLRDDQPRFPATPQGRAEYGAQIERIIRDAGERAALLFDRMPKAVVVAQPYPEFMGPRANSYSPPAPDGSRPATYQFPVFGITTLSQFDVRSTAYHETIPGHHFQFALQMEDTTLPRFRKLAVFGDNGAYGEGWALYAERLVAESGWYEGDPVGLLGQLDGALLRARRLVVDTGIHAKHWTRQQAIDYMGTLSGLSTTNEVDRYVVMPGQACAYMVGALKIVELRERAKRELGAKFSIKEFHNVVLGTGTVPLDILGQRVDEWIAEKKG